MKRNLMLTPGPTNVPQRLCEVLGRPIIHHRTPQFQQYLKEAVEGLQYVLQTENDVYILASSGTGAMEASVCSLVSPGDKVITVQGGKFGERWTDLCRAFQAEPYVLDGEWGRAVTAAQIKDCLEKDRSIKAVYVTLCETSTGVTPDIKAIGEVVAATDAVLVVDAVSGLGVEDLQTDNWKVDVVASGSHKGFMLPPGVGFVSMSGKAKALMARSSAPKFYFDLRKYESVFAKPDTPFTPAIGIIMALTESLKIFQEQGLQKLFAHYARLAQGVRAGIKALGLNIFTAEGSRSNVLTAVCIPDGIDGSEVVKRMRDEHGVTIAGGQGELKGRVVRIAHMGSLDEYDLLTGIACFEKVLNDLGYSFELGSGVAAVQKYFNEH
ncbi:MAG: pyridoxal-phosphate-dependent aminotransferase family protein [Candidatus Omnitrophota bacterium]